MKIQRGIVKYKDRSDIVCTYALTDDGKQYYFLDENDAKKFSNGNRIATTALVEAVDPMAKAVNVGIIDVNGAIVVPFENRSIRPVNDNIIVVEKATPTSQNVLDAIELRNDPASATKLVSTPATIKENINKQMGTEGKYIFNDQFSEATVCDINGTNLVNGESYSFISMANDKLYLGKNTVETPIAEFSLTTYELNATPEVNTEAIDVSATAVDQQVVEDALTSQASPVEGQEVVAEAPVEGVAAEVPVEAVPVEGQEVVAEAPVEGVAAEVPAEAAPVEGQEAVAEAPVEGVAAEVPAEATPVEGQEAVAEAPVEGVAAEVPAEAAPVEGQETVAEAPVEGVAAEVPADGMLNAEAAPAPIDASEVAAVTGSDVVAAENVDFPIEGDTPPVDTVSEDFSTSNESISDDLKAFTDGTPLDGVAEVPVEAAPVEGEVAQEEVPAEAPVEGVTDEIPTEEVTAEAPTEEVVPPVVEEANNEVEAKEEVADAVEEEVKEEPVNIDAETVFATVDKNQNGVIDSDEVMIPQEKEEEKEEITNNDTLLTDIFAEEKHEREELPKRDFSFSRPSYNDDFSSMYSDTKLDRVSYGSFTAGGDNIMDDVAKSMSDLMRQNKEQKSAITQYQSKIDNLESQARMLNDKYQDQSMRYDSLANKLRDLESESSRLETRNQMLESRVRDQERLIASQERELNVLRPQVESKQDLVRLLADARNLLSSDSYGYNEEESYYRRVA